MVTKQFDTGPGGPATFPKDGFPAFRHTWLAMLFVFGEFVPAWVRVNKIKVRITAMNDIARSLGLKPATGGFEFVESLHKDNPEFLEKIKVQKERRLSQIQVLGYRVEGARQTRRSSKDWQLTGLMSRLRWHASRQMRPRSFQNSRFAPALFSKQYRSWRRW